MELVLIVPVDQQEQYHGPTEWLNRTQWRVSEPLDTSSPKNLKYHCISYVWGSGRSKDRLFQSKIEISDQTKPALEAAIAAADAAAKESEMPAARAFWIDAICVPQIQGPKRNATLESMGFIYGSATSTIVVLQQPVWAIFEQRGSVNALSFDEMAILEEDVWVKSPWTYQEIVNSQVTIFAGMHPDRIGHYIPGERLLNCIGLSLAKWKKECRKGEGAVVKTFPNLSAMQDTAADWLMAGYLDRYALGVLSNMALRRYEHTMETNNILASLGALTTTASWTTKHGTTSELVSMFMEICEARNDYSFIYTKDIRDETAGNRWRPNPEQPGYNIIGTPARNQEDRNEKQEARNLNPILALPCSSKPVGNTQRGRHDSAGFWLGKMVPLQSSTTLSARAHSWLTKWLRWSEPQSASGQGFADGKFQLGGDDIGVKLDVILVALSSKGFSGSPEPQVCTDGVFFSQQPLAGKVNVEMFAAASIAWTFGAPALARWTEHRPGDTNAEAGVIKYTAGVFVGVVDESLAAWLLMS